MSSHRLSTEKNRDNTRSIVVPANAQAPEFDRRAKSYSDHSQIQERLGDWTFQWVKPSTNDESLLKAIELGSGTGLFSRRLVEYFPQLLATDISPNMLEVLKQRLPQIQTSPVDAWKAIHSEPTPKWDRIFASGLLQWSPDPIETLKNWSRAMSSDGKLVCGLFAKPSLQELNSIEGFRSPIVWRSEQAWNEAFQKAGFEIVRSQSKLVVQQYDSVKTFFRSLHRTGSVVKNLSSPKLLKKIISEYGRQNAADGIVRASWCLFRIEAKLDNVPKSN